MCRIGRLREGVACGGVCVYVCMCMSACTKGGKVLRTISRTDSRACDNWIAREHDVVVLPRHEDKDVAVDNTATLEKYEGGRTYASLSTCTKRIIWMLENYS